MVESKLNINIPAASFRFESLIERLLPRRIFYKLLLRGKGIEFDGYRELASDDDSALIDWKASIRANDLLVKQYVEEKDIKILFLVDVSDGMVFGSTRKLKCEYSAEIAGSLGWVLLNEPTDQLGYIFYNDDIVDARMPMAGKKQYEAFCYQLSNPEIYGGKSDLNKALKKIIEMLDPSITLIIIISDFMNLSEESKRLLEDIAGYIETVAVIVKDPLDITLPELNREITIENSNTGERILVNPRIAREAYRMNAKLIERKTRIFFRGSNIDYVRLITNKDFCPKLALFFKERAERRD